MCLLTYLDLPVGNFAINFDPGVDLYKLWSLGLVCGDIVESVFFQTQICRFATKSVVISEPYGLLLITVVFIMCVHSYLYIYK